MDQIHHRDKPLERTAKTTAKAGPKPWEIKQYTYQEPIDDQRPSHCDPRLEVAPQSHDPHQTDSDFIPSDDYGYGHPAFGIGFTPQLDASYSTASELGTLAGGPCFSKPKPKRMTTEQALARLDQLEYGGRLRVSEMNWKAADRERRKNMTVEQRIKPLRPR